MTLLLAVCAPRGVVMLSDGICRRLIATGESDVLRQDQRKIFPFEKRPIAVAHHGQNRFGQDSASEIVPKLEASVEQLSTLRQIAQYIREVLDDRVRRTLTDLCAQGIRDGCGFWVAGYGFDDETPSFYEVFWPPGGHRVELAEHRFLVEGGDGKSFSQRVRHNHPSFSFTEETAETWSVGTWSDYLERLYKSAAREPGARRVFGGKVQKLGTTKAGNTWLTK